MGIDKHLLVHFIFGQSVGLLFGELRAGSIVPKSRPEEVWDDLLGERCMVTFFICFFILLVSW